MKQFLTLFTFLLLAFYCPAQADSLKAPYEKVPVFPPVRLTLADKTTFTKKDLPAKKPVMLMVFSPDCDHCQHETEEMMKHMDWFSNATIVMATMMSLEAMTAFAEKYKLGDHTNIIVGRDSEYFLSHFYQIRNLPFLAFYDKKGRLISVSRGTMPVDKVVAELKKPGKDN